MLAAPSREHVNNVHRKVTAGGISALMKISETSKSNSMGCEIDGGPAPNGKCQSCRRLRRLKRLDHELAGFHPLVKQSKHLEKRPKSFGATATRTAVRNCHFL